MTKLHDLIKSLRAFTILIVENEFTYLDKGDIILGHLCMIGSKRLKQVQVDLQNHGFKILAEGIENFFISWNQIDEDSLVIFNRMGADYIERFLESIKLEHILKDPLNLLNKELAEDNEDTIKSIFLKNGIFNYETVPKYVDILKILDSIDECRVIIRKDRPVATEWDKFKTELEQTIEQTHSSFCLSIIDKNLGDGANEGRELIKDLINDHKDFNDFNHICCLYTSTAAPIVPINYDDYFVQEISKNSSDTIGDLVSSLAYSAYAEVFNSMRVKTIASAEKTMEIVLKNQKNIKYIIDKSQEEGILPYDSLRYWNELSVQNFFDNQEIKDFKFIASLASFFTKDYLNDHPNFADISEELKKLNSFELFDYNVNKKHFALAPGDIWKSEDGSYYILVGQVCDLQLRRDSNERNAKIGELFKIQFGTSPKNKFDIVVTNGRKSIYVDNFYDHATSNFTTLKIDISTPNIFFADLKVLDLAMYNDDGSCSLDVNSELEENLRQVLPVNRDKYYDELREMISLLVDADREQLRIAIDANPLNFSKLNFNVENTLVSFGLKRICRLKGRYFDSLYNNYLNHKGRVDLNLIDSANEICEQKTFYCQFGNDDTSLKNIDVDLYTKKNLSYVLKAELISKLPTEFHTLAKYFDDEINISDKKVAEIIHKDNDSFLIKFRYRYDEKKVAEISQLDFEYKNIFKERSSLYKDKIYHIMNDTENRVFSQNRITFDELKLGIVIPDTNEKIFIVNGFIKTEKIER